MTIEELKCYTINNATDTESVVRMITHDRAKLRVQMVGLCDDELLLLLRRAYNELGMVRARIVAEIKDLR